MSRRLPSLLALSLAGMLASSAPVLADSPAPAPQVNKAERQVPPATPQAVDEDARRYAEREKPAQEQKDYEGGDYIVIGAGAGTLIIVLLVLILVL